MHVLGDLVHRVTSGQASISDMSPYYLADYAIKNDLKEILSVLLQANDELLIYIISSPIFDARALLPLVRDGALTIESILTKLPLLQPFI